MSTPTKHTAGPWMINSYENKGETVHEVVDCHPFPPGSKHQYGYKNIICRLEGARSARPANASLIAAAPEMLEALETLLYRLEICEQDAMNNDDPAYEIDVEVEQAKAAILKAKGGI